MYSLVPLENLSAFLQSLIPGVCSSNTIASELLGGSSFSNCATILIPTQTDDCVCHILLDRDTAINAIRQYGLSVIKLD